MWQSTSYSQHWHHWLSYVGIIEIHMDILKPEALHVFITMFLSHKRWCTESEKSPALIKIFTVLLLCDLDTWLSIIELLETLNQNPLYSLFVIRISYFSNSEQDRCLAWISRYQEFAWICQRVVNNFPVWKHLGLKFMFIHLINNEQVVQVLLSLCQTQFKLGKKQ